MIGFRRGHNFQAVGARCYVKEEEIAEQIRQEVKKIFDKHCFKYVDCTPENMTRNNDLKFGVTKCNESNCDLFFSIHLNASEGKTDKPLGVEVITFSNKFKEASDVLSNLVNLGFKNRGIKHNRNLYELKNTSCKSMIIEVFFVNSKADVELFNSVGVVKIAQAIAYGVMGIEGEVIKPITNNKARYRVCVGSYAEYQNAVKAKKELEKLGVECFIVKKED